jgi:hypothetical protein
MATAGVRLPFVVASNLVFSSDGGRVFMRSADGDLWSVNVPAHPEEMAAPPHMELPASQGIVTAVGLLEGRLAVIRVTEEEIEASHGDAGVGGQPSKPLRLRLAASGLVLGDASRLDPYVLWWGDVDQMCEELVGLTLVRGRDDRLFALTPHGQQAFDPIAEEVTLLASAEDEGYATVFVGRTPSPQPRSWLVGLFRRSEDNSPAIYELSTRWPWAPGPCRKLRSGPSPQAVAGYPGPGTFSYRLVGYEEGNGIWIGTWRWLEGPSCECRFIAPKTHKVVGIVREPEASRGEVALIVQDASKDGLWLLGPEGTPRPFVSGPMPIERVECCPSRPLIAYVRDAYLHFLWLEDAQVALRKR